MANNNELTIIRCTFCADGVRGGTRLFLYEVNNKFLVATRFQNVGYRSNIINAIALFEKTAMGN